MSFMNPTGLWFLLGVPILIIIYMIKSQHEDRPVSSTYIWKLSSRFMKKKLPLQKIKKFLAFLLQLLIIVGVALLAARPAVVNGKCTDFVAVIDASASMQTVDENGSTRFERAVLQVEELTKEIENGHTVSVIVAGEEATWLIQKSTSPNEIKLALNNARCAYGSCDTEEAMALARELCLTSKNAQVLFYTDNEYTETRNVQIVNMSAQEWNVAVTGATATVQEKNTVFSASITSSNQDISLTVGLRIDGAIVDAQIVSCAQNLPTTISFTAKDLTTYETAEIFVEAKDALPEDNRYILCQSAKRTYNVLLVSQSPLYLQSALQALGTCQVTVTDSVDEAAMVGYDLYVFDCISPVTYPTDGSVLVFGTQRLPAGMTAGDMVDTAAAITINHDVQSPLFEGLSLIDTTAINYCALSGSIAWTNLLICEESVVAATREMGKGLQFTLVSFDLRDSNLPMQANNFLTFVNNLVEYSVPKLLKVTDHTACSTVELTVLPAAQQLHVALPDGSVKQLSTISNSASLKVDQVGLYTAVMTTAEGGEYVDFFVHIPENESAMQIIPALSMDISFEDTANAEDATAEIWFWLSLAMLVIVLAEWGWYYHEQY